jgi:hypothetical protein
VTIGRNILTLYGQRNEYINVTKGLPPPIRSTLPVPGLGISHIETGVHTSKLQHLEHAPSTIGYHDEPNRKGFDYLIRVTGSANMGSLFVPHECEVMSDRCWRWSDAEAMRCNCDSGDRIINNRIPLALPSILCSHSSTYITSLS